MSEESARARAGDTIRRLSDGQEFVCLCDERNGHVYTAGWPLASEDMGEFEVSERATSDERREMLEAAIAGQPWVAELARRQLGDGHD